MKNKRWYGIVDTSEEMCRRAAFLFARGWFFCKSAMQRFWRCGCKQPSQRPSWKEQEKELRLAVNVQVVQTPDGAGQTSSGFRVRELQLHATCWETNRRGHVVPFKRRWDEREAADLAMPRTVGARREQVPAVADSSHSRQ